MKMRNAKGSLQAAKGFSQAAKGFSQGAKGFSSFVRWVGPYHPADRVEPFLFERYGLEGFDLPTQRYNVMLVSSRPQTKAVVAARIQGLGGAIDNADAGKSLVQATLTPRQLMNRNMLRKSR